jgi:4-hydroxy-L-threonine phosphate dehydrogenase PdxA
MRTFVFGLILSLALVPLGGSYSGASENHARHGGSGTNPLIEEMVILDSVFCKVVSAVALGDGARAHKALESMHGAMEKTHEGVHAGTVTLPRNNDRMKEFVNLDLKFHEKLEALAEAGERNDQEKMLALTKELLGRCVECHRMFRR